MDDEAKATITSASEFLRRHHVPSSGPILIILVGVLAVFFFRSFLPHYTLFSNDGPLGRLVSQYQKMPQKFSGAWLDLNSIGYSLGGAWPNVTSVLLWLLGPLAFSKFYAPIGLLILGLSAHCFFRQLGLAPVACILGALAATLNSGFFSTACWGMAAHPISVAMSFLAMATLIQPTPKREWLKAAVAGSAVGVSAAEGADIGAIFSLFVAAFAVYRSLLEEGSLLKRLCKGCLQILLIAVIAACVAAQPMKVLTATQVQDASATQQDIATKKARWDWATQWSLPKREALSLLVPGLFGYRMEGPAGAYYWGAVGRDAAWDRYFENGQQGNKPSGFIRFSGGGAYGGILVVLLAIWASFQAFRKERSIFLLSRKKWIYFWLVVLCGSLLLSFGRHAPFYWLFYLLPYSWAIRNPAKFLHVLNWALIILFAYGVHGLNSLYLPSSEAPGKLRARGFGDWWKAATKFERGWWIGSILVFGMSLIAVLIYISCETGLEIYLQQVGFPENPARDIAKFSFRQAGWYLLFLSLAMALFWVISAGWFANARHKLAAVLLGMLLVLDLGHANSPWIVYWNYRQKYESNPILDFLRDTPYQHRVATIPPWFPQLFEVPPGVLSMAHHWNDSYQLEWMQQLFPYYDVQSLDLVQLRTTPPDLARFESAMQFQGTKETLSLIARRWQLTNTRYLLGPSGLLSALNQTVATGGNSFSVVLRFDFFPKAGILHPTKQEEITSVLSTNGPFTLYEFRNALPRAHLYPNWQVITNDTTTLNILTDSAFDLSRTVLVSSPLPFTPGTTNELAGSVTFSSYAPKNILLQAQATTPSVLLLNDRFDPDWKVFVDGRPATLLRCNFLMRGVLVPSGEHKIQFRFLPNLNGLYLSCAATTLGLFMTGFLVIGNVKRRLKEPTTDHDH